MPIYEYRCEVCDRKSSLFFRSIAAVEEKPACAHCGERRLRRLMSRFWSRRANDDALGVMEPALEDNEAPFYAGDLAGGYGSGGFRDAPDDGEDLGDGDVVQLARETREMARVMGEPLDSELDAALGYIERGADPEDVLGELDEAPPGDASDEA